MAQTTPILIMDEPTNQLDIRHQTSFLNPARQPAVEHGLAIVVLPAGTGLEYAPRNRGYIDQISAETGVRTYA